MQKKILGHLDQANNQVDGQHIAGGIQTDPAQPNHDYWLRDGTSNTPK